MMNRFLTVKNGVLLRDGVNNLVLTFTKRSFNTFPVICELFLLLCERKSTFRVDSSRFEGDNEKTRSIIKKD